MSARAFHGVSFFRVGDRAASCCRAVQAHGFSLKADRSAQAAETTVPQGQMLPATQLVSL